MKRTVRRVIKTITIAVIVVFAILIILLVIFICIPKDDWYTQKKFGNNYELLLVSRNNCEMVYRIKYKIYDVIPEESILEYDFDKRWIIAKSKKYNYPLELTLFENDGYHYVRPPHPDSVSIHYWIIDKNIPINVNDPNAFETKHERADDGNYYDYLILKAGLTGPLDSIQFLELRKKYNIPDKLILKKLVIP